MDSGLCGGRLICVRRAVACRARGSMLMILTEKVMNFAFRKAILALPCIPSCHFNSYVKANHIML